MSRALLVPLQLGCCPDKPRCALCPPPPAPPDDDLIRALLDHYRAERARPGDIVTASFFGGPPPSPAQLTAAGGAPIHARVRPDLLSRHAARRLVDAGVTAIELDALTLHDGALRAAGRRYTGALVLEMARGLRDLGVRVGVVLAPGLPGTDHDTALSDARRLAPQVDVARIHPVLVLAGARLRQAHLDGLYEPLTLAQAITTCHAMLAIFETHDVKVIRMGMQPGPDGFGRAVAGPAHPALRQLVDARRALEHLRGLVSAQAPRPGDRIVVRCAPADETPTRGPLNRHVRELRAEHQASAVHICPDPTLARGTWRVAVERAPLASASSAV